MKMIEILKQLIPMRYRIIFRCFDCGRSGDYHINYIVKYSFKPQKKYYICRVDLNYGVISVLKHYVFVHSFLQNNGFIPIIDYEMEYIFSEGRIGEVSTWDYLFDQTITVKEAIKKGRVFAGNLNLCDGEDEEKCLYLNGDRHDALVHINEDNWKDYYGKARELLDPIWKPKKEIIDKAESIVKGKKCIGVALRENFSVDAWAVYSKETVERTYSHHPLSCGLDDAINIVRDKMRIWDADYIFLSTRYKESCEKFYNEFGDKVIWVERERVSFDNFNVTNEIIEINDPKVQYEKYYNTEIDVENRKTYLTELICLASCDYLIGAPSGSVTGALMINGGKYKDICLFKTLNDIRY